MFKLIGFSSLAYLGTQKATLGTNGLSITTCQNEGGMIRLLHTHGKAHANEVTPLAMLSWHRRDLCGL